MENRRVLVVGLDGATFDVLRPLCDAGCMPHFSSLVRGGAAGVLRSTLPSVTPVAWTSFLTGCGPQCHGIWDFRRLECGSRLVLNTGASIRCPTLLDRVAREGRTVVSINLPMTYPPRWPGSLVVGGFDSPSTEAALAAYPEFARRLRRRVPDFSVQPVWRCRPKDREALESALRQTEASFRARVEAARIADELYDWSLMIVQFQELDGLQHRVWESLIPERRGARAAVRAVRATMRVLDNCLADLMELAQRCGATVCVVSDHGFGAYRGTVGSNEVLRRAGIVRVRGAWGAVSYGAGRAASRLRKWLYRRRQPGVSTAVLGRSLRSQFPLDWKRTLAWSPHGDLGALIYVNTPERFGTGPVQGARQRDEVMARVTHCLTAANEPESDRALFDTVIDVAAQFGRDPVGEGLPDLVAIPSPGIHTRTKVQGSWIKAARYTGTHRREGIWALYGPGIRAGVRQTSDIEDMAPTLLALLGIGHGHGCGRVLARVLGDEIGTVEGGISPDAAPCEWTYSRMEEQRIAQRLEALGYLQ